MPWGPRDTVRTKKRWSAASASTGGTLPSVTFRQAKHTRTFGFLLCCDSKLAKGTGGAELLHCLSFAEVILPKSRRYAEVRVSETEFSVGRPQNTETTWRNPGATPRPAL